MWIWCLLYVVTAGGGALRGISGHHCAVHSDYSTVKAGRGLGRHSPSAWH